MRFRNTSASWGALSKILHWLVVFLIIIQWAFAKYAAAQPLSGKLAPLSLHKSFGITILALTIIRLTWRLLSRGPSTLASLRPWERPLARISHVLLYGLITVLPLTGWLMSSARNFPVSWFGVFQLPDLAPPSHLLFEEMKHLHEVLFTGLIAVALLHCLGALKHHFLDRNEVLIRMLPFARIDDLRGKPSGRGE